MFTITFIVFVEISSIFVEAQRPDIVDEILPEVKQKNQIGYLNCTVVNKGNESVVQWSKVETVNGGNPILLSEDDKTVYRGNTGINEDSGQRKYDIQSRINGRRVTYMLVIRYLAEDDAGDYLCTIRIQGVQWPEWPKKIGKLTVQIAPQIQPSINSIYEKDIGSSLQLTCESHGNPYPNITWKREDGQELPMGGFQSRGATLNLIDIQRNDRGNYICVADNNVKPPDSFKVEVIVFFQPSCRPVQSTVGQAQNRGFNAKLECIVAGYPQPSMKWMKETENGKLIEIDDDDKYDITKQFSSQLQNDEFWYTLLVKNVEAKDYTNYHCVGTNKYGDGETTISLFETMQCQGLHCSNLINTTSRIKTREAASSQTGVIAGSVAGALILVTIIIIIVIFAHRRYTSIKGFEKRNRDVKVDTKKEESNYSSIEEQKDYTQRDMYDKLTPTENTNQYETIMRTDNRGNNEELYEQLQEKESGNNEELYEQLQEKESIAKEGNSDNQNIPLKTKDSSDDKFVGAQYAKEYTNPSFVKELYEQLQEKESIAKEGNSDNQNIPPKTKDSSDDKFVAAQYAKEYTNPSFMK